MDGLKIYVISHKKVHIPKNNFLYPLQVGTSKSKEKILGFFHDDAGLDNISDRNNQYCEMTGIYWVWKNQINSEYMGFFHYRRFLAFSNIYFPQSIRNNWKQYIEYTSLTSNVLNNLGYQQDLFKIVKMYDLIIPKCSKLKYHNIDNFYKLYEPTFRVELNYAFEVVTKKYPEYCNALEKCKNSIEGYHSNIFIMKKTIFEEYCSWIFDVLGTIYEGLQNGDLVSDKERLLGYIAEFLTGVFICYKKENNTKMCELQGIFFRHTDGKQHRLLNAYSIFVNLIYRIIIPLGSRRERIMYSVWDKLKI